MKILFLYSSEWMKTHLLKALELNGHQVFPFLYEGGMGKIFDSDWRKNYRPNMNKQLLKTIEDGGYELLFSVVYDDVFMDKTPEKIKSTGILWINYHVDIPTQWYRTIKIAPFVDFFVYAQPEQSAALNHYFKKKFYMPMASFPFNLSKTKEEMKSSTVKKILFIGSANSVRRKIITNLLEHGIPVEVAGTNWITPKTEFGVPFSAYKLIHDIRHYLLPRIKYEGFANFKRFFVNFKKRDEKILAIPESCINTNFIEYDRMMDMYSSYSGVLGINIMGDFNGCMISQQKLRDFEVTMAGGAYLCNYSRGIDAFFKDGQEVFYWETTEELILKANRLLNDTDFSVEMRINANKKANELCSWTKRIKELFEFVEENR